MRPADCCTNTMSATNANPEQNRSYKRQANSGLKQDAPSSLSWDIYACRSTLTLAVGSSTLSLTGIGTRSNSFASSSFSACRTLRRRCERADPTAKKMWVTYRQQLELVRERKRSEQFQRRHCRSQVLVIRRHRPSSMLWNRPEERSYLTR